MEARRGRRPSQSPRLRGYWEGVLAGGKPHHTELNDKGADVRRRETKLAKCPKPARRLAEMALVGFRSNGTRLTGLAELWTSATAKVVVLAE